MKVRPKHTTEAKAKMSKSRIEYLKNNPDKHPWKRHDKFKSKPCENVKTFLMDNNIQFIEEYTPDNIDRLYSIDIALPDKKISLEINGNQHYERDGTLKQYYQKRQNILEKAGWTVYQIHYSACYNLNKWSDFIIVLKDSQVKVEFDYFTYVPRGKKLPYDLCECGDKKYKQAKNCEKCFRLNSRKVKNRPTKEELEKLIWEKPTTSIAKDFKVSDKAVQKWCDTYHLSKPPRGYWAKKRSQLGSNQHTPVTHLTTV